MEALEDADIIIDEAMGEKISFRIGECFVEMTDNNAKIYHKRIAEETTKEMDKLNEEKADIEKQMKDLKAHLYAKFGSNINLDEGE